jgi:hypothetical protein
MSEKTQKQKQRNDREQAWSGDSQELSAIRSRNRQVRGKRGEREGVEQGGEMAQTMYAHMNK